MAGIPEFFVILVFPLSFQFVAHKLSTNQKDKEKNKITKTSMVPLTLSFVSSLFLSRWKRALTDQLEAIIQSLYVAIYDHFTASVQRVCAGIRVLHVVLVYRWF